MAYTGYMVVRLLMSVKKFDAKSGVLLLSAGELFASEVGAFSCLAVVKMERQTI